MMDLKKAVTLAFLVLFLHGCFSHSVQEKACSEQDSCLESVFFHKALQDSLNKFISLCDSIPNRYSPNVVYSIFFSLDDKDTIVSFFSYPFVMLTVKLRDEDSLSIYGAVQKDNKVVAVCGRNCSIPPKLLNKKLLSLEIFAENTFEYRHMISGAAYYAGDDFSLHCQRYTMKHDSITYLDSRSISCSSNERYVPFGYTEQNIEKAVTSMAVKDTLYSFMEEYPVFNHSYSEDIVYSVGISKEGLDTIVTYTVNAYVSESPIPYNKIGAVRDGNKVIAVSDHILSPFVDERHLDREVYAKHTLEFYNVVNNLQDADIETIPVSKKYKVKGDSLEFIEKRQSRSDYQDRISRYREFPF